MLASDLLREFNTRLDLLEARTQGLQRIITSLEGLQMVFASNTAGVSGDPERFDKLLDAYLEQKEAALQEVDNLRAAHRDVEQAISRMAPEHQVVLSLRYIAGLNQSEVAKKTGVTRKTVISREAHAMALLDYHLQNF
jgi:RNA polymerase sigma factor (sigma-70 family)